MARNTALDSPRITSQKYSKEENLSAIFGERGRRGDQHRGAEEPADHREDEPRAEREPRPGLLRHGVGLIV